MIVVVNLPQRFQIVNAKSPVGAGILMLPLLIASGLGSGLGGFLASKKNISSPSLLGATVFTTIGTGLLSSLPTSVQIPARQYGYQVICGIGLGASAANLQIITRFAVKEDESATAIGAMTQIRVLGGSIGLAIASLIFNHRATLSLRGILTPAEVSLLLSNPEAIKVYPPSQIKIIRSLYGNAYRDEMRFALYIAVVAVVAAAFTYQRKPPDVNALMGLNKAPDVQHTAPAGRALTEDDPDSRKHEAEVKE
ncbi:MAG: hypothetical protein Q9218_000285 [Villophora microphyllina]